MLGLSEKVEITATILTSKKYDKIGHTFLISSLSRISGLIEVLIKNIKLYTI